jgi:hypothetical protein
VTAEKDGSKLEFTFTNVGFGGFAFFDAKYVEAALSFSGGSSKGETTSTLSDGTTTATTTTKDKGSYSAFDISALGKYPVAFGKFTVFPLLGIDYQIALSQKNEDGDDFEGLDGDGEVSDLSALWFKAGAGGDFDINEKLYLRGEILYGIRLHNKLENDAKELFKDAGLEDDDIKIHLGHGPAFKLAVGYRF